MQIVKDFLAINEYSRPGKKLAEILAIVVHWTANPASSAKNDRDYFNAKQSGMSGYGSAHYIVGKKGEIIQCIPEDEIAYHCGSSKKDPESGRIYTDYARKKFGKYAINIKTTSPNFCTLGIEMSPMDIEGNFTNETLNSTSELCAAICRKYNLSAQDITTHHNIVGWKDCPRLWAKNPQLFEIFKETVQEKIKNS